MGVTLNKIFLFCLLLNSGFAYGNTITKIDSKNLDEDGCEGFYSSFPFREFLAPSYQNQSGDLGQESIKLKCPLDVKNFCDSAKDSCLKYTKSLNCMSYDRKEQELINANPDSWKKKADYLGKRFREILNDDKFLTACCENDNLCKSLLKSTSLRVFKDEVDSQYAAYQPGSQLIKMARSRILNAYRPEAIDNVLIHELGHACQYNRALRIGRKQDIIAGCKSEQNIGDAATEILPKDVRDCINNSLIEAKRLNQGVDTKNNCFNIWQMEIFADAVFSTYQSSLFHWAAPCSSKMNMSHPDITVYLACIFKMPNFQKLFCEKSQ